MTQPIGFHWRRNTKGNLVAEWDGLLLTVFRRWRLYSWCVNCDGELTFSESRYEVEHEAVEAVEQDVTLSVGEL